MTKVVFNCEECIFAEMENGNQVGCKTGRADMVENKELEGGFYEFNRNCNLKRGLDWLEKQEPGDPEEIARREIRENLNCDVLIVCGKKQKLNMKTLKSVFGMSPRPNKVILMYFDYLSFADSTFLTEKMDGLGIKYECVMNYESERKRALYGCVKKVESEFYIFANSGEKINPGTIKRLEEVINKEYKQCVLFTTKAIGGEYPTVVHSGVHLQLGNVNILKKIPELAKQEGREDLVIEW